MAKISVTQCDSFVYYTPGAYKNKSYIIKWNFIGNKKDSFSFELPGIEDQILYKLTDFSTNGKNFVLCFGGYIYILKLDADKLSIFSSYYFKNSVIIKSKVTNENLKLISTTTGKTESEKELKYCSLDFKNITQIKPNGTSLYLSHLGPSSYFSLHPQSIMWTDPLNYTVYQRHDSLETTSELKLNKFFSPPDNNTQKSLNKKSNFGAKLSIIMSAYDSLAFDIIEEVYFIKDSSFIIIYSPKGTGMKVAKPWTRSVAYFNGSNLLTTKQLNPKMVNVIDLFVFIFNEKAYCLVKNVGMLQVKSLDEVFIE